MNNGKYLNNGEYSIDKKRCRPRLAEGYMLELLYLLSDLLFGCWEAKYEIREECDYL